MNLRKKKDNSIQKLHNTRYKIKNDAGIFKWKSASSLRALANVGSDIPNDAVPIPNTENYFIDKFGNVYSNSFYKNGLRLAPYQNFKGYLTVNVKFVDQIMKPIPIHCLMCITFIQEDYLKQGLCCLHLDNNKTNNCLDNLRVGTYSENNKQAYRDGLNHGNRRKKV